MNTILPILFLLFSINVNAQKTERIFYYSFLHHQALELSTVRHDNEIKTNLGASLKLISPISNENASYYWEGPNGFTSYQPELVFDKVEENQTGVYKLSVKLDGNIKQLRFYVQVLKTQ